MHPKTIPQIVAELRAQPGIDITRLAKGTKLIVETTQGVFEFSVTNPRHGLVRVFGTDARLRAGISGQVLESFYDIEGRVAVPNWITKSLRIQITFKNGVYPCTPALSARVEGAGWHYEVF